jgi:hypothetical protein
MKLLLISLFAPLALVAAGAAPTIVGAWDCIATDARGHQTQWSLAIKQDAGKLAATLRSGDGYSIDLLDPKFEDSQFSFHFKINPSEAIEVLLKVDGDYMEGRYGGSNAGAGLFKATRTGAANVSGTWTGEWEIDPDGKRDSPHRMVLIQEGKQVTGTAGPQPSQQLAIANGKLTGDKLTFELGIPLGPRLVFDFTVAGDTMSGTAVLSMNGTERKLKLAAKRTAR